ncbi:unnamed protein product, partial [Closterium sp. NIES-54]
SERVYESGFQDSHWVCGYGIHRLFCETNLHPHQQHHCRIVINKDSQVHNGGYTGCTEARPQG